MTKIPFRRNRVWRSSVADTLRDVSGVFVFFLAPSIMVPQAIEFLRRLGDEGVDAGPIMNGFIRGMQYAPPATDRLYYFRNFTDASALFSVEYAELMTALQQLELHFDLAFVIQRMEFWADYGSGPDEPLLAIERMAAPLGVGFEVEERGTVRETLTRGDVELELDLVMAQRHYSTGWALLAANDQMAGLIDAAFVQFYLCTEGVLGSENKRDALKVGAERYGTAFDANLASVVSHVYVARHRFFGHSKAERHDRSHDHERTFAIATQALVARWCARRLMQLATGVAQAGRVTRLRWRRQIARASTICASGAVVQSTNLPVALARAMHLRDEDGPVEH